MGKRYIKVVIKKKNNFLDSQQLLFIKLIILWKKLADDA